VGGIPHEVAAGLQKRRPEELTRYQLDAFQTVPEDRAKNCTEPRRLLSDLPTHRSEHRLPGSAHSAPNTGREDWTRRKYVFDMSNGLRQANRTLRMAHPSIVGR
jgi:hypothetical protein